MLYKGNFFYITLFLVNSSHTRDYMQGCSRVRSEVMFNMSVQSIMHKNWASNVFLLFHVILWAVKLFSLVFSKKIIFKLQCSYCSSILSGVFLHPPTPRSYTSTLWLRLKSPENTMVCQMIQFEKGIT